MNKAREYFSQEIEEIKGMITPERREQSKKRMLALMIKSEKEGFLIKNLLLWLAKNLLKLASG
jgi:hypothetical protein